LGIREIIFFFFFLKHKMIGKGVLLVSVLVLFLVIFGFLLYALVQRKQPVEIVATLPLALPSSTVDDDGVISSISSIPAEIRAPSSSSPFLIPKTWMTTSQFSHANADLLANVHHNIGLNPDYDFVFFDDEACEQFLDDHFDHDVREAFARLIPGAYRADLFRYCYLYVHGGVYLDINKTFMVPLSEIVQPHHEMVLVQDRFPRGIFQAFMAVRPRHPLLRKAIDACVKNVQEKARVDSLAVAGPILLQNEFRNMYGATLENIHNPSIGVLRLTLMTNRVLNQNKKEVIHSHPIDKHKFQRLSTKPHYGSAKEYYADVFIPVFPPAMTMSTRSEKGGIPRTLCMTYSKRAIPNLLKPIVDHNVAMSEGWNIECFHESSRRQFIQQHFGAKVLYAYDQLIPGAYRADLFRFCFLYERGGVYMDVNKKLVLPLQSIPCTAFDVLLVRDLDGANIANCFIVSQPKLPFWKEVVQGVVANVLTRFYGKNSLDPTGPGLLRKVFDRYFNTTEGLPRQRGVHTLKGVRVMVWDFVNDGNQLVIVNENNQRVVDFAPIAKQVRNKVMIDNTGIQYYETLYHRRQIYR